MFSPLNSNDVRFGDPGSPNTEPMTLGSPVSSPKSKANSSQNYLPPYLFGEVSTSPVGAATWSTPKQHNPSFSSAPSQHNSLSHYRDQQLSFQSPASRSLINTPTAGKSGGPPVQGLLYTSTTPASSFHITQFDTTPKTPGRPTTETINNDSILTPSKSFCLNSNSHMSPAQIDPFFTQGEALKNSEQLDESWVTVFGFPSASASFILQQFSQYGNIIEHKIHPVGNWMHIRYQSKLQAKKALSKNGKIFSGNIMIGVKPCIEMDLMESSKENSLMESSIATGQDSFQSDILEPIKPSLKNIRPLTQAYQSPNAHTQVVKPKSEGIVSKAFQYLWKL